MNRKWAYYNEFDPRAAAWLRELIRQGLIAPGEVDERSIEDVVPTELHGFAQCHFFAGVGVWSYALRRAGWPDDRPVWTGSCPCQPFSSAGKGDGFDDERHLWPALHHLIACGKSPDVPVFGEQVASKDGLAWLDLVQTDLEGEGYAFWSVDLCSAGFGAPHIRQRLYWVADAKRDGLDRSGNAGAGGRDELSDCGAVGGMAITKGVGLEGCGRGEAGEFYREPPPGGWSGDNGNFGGLADAGSHGARQHPGELHRHEGEHEVRAKDRNNAPLVGGAAGRLADADGWDTCAEREQRQQLQNCGDLHNGRPGPTNGFWRDVDWLHCRDGKFRPVEPGTFPLVDGAPARVGRLRGYGNAINAEVAQAFIEAYLDL